jgi:hypothetical protein
LSKEKVLKFAVQPTFIERVPYHVRAPGYWVELVKIGKQYVINFGDKGGLIDSWSYRHKEDALRLFRELKKHYKMYNV